MINIGKTFGLSDFKGIKGDLIVEKEPLLKSEISHIPGIIEKIELIDKWGIKDDDPFILAYIPENDFVGFTRETKVFWSDDTEGVVMGRLPYKQAVISGLIKKLLDEFAKKELIDEKIEMQFIPIIDLHQPKIKGCRATLELSSKHSFGNSFSININGFGGGSGKTIGITRSSNISTEGECIYYCVPMVICVKYYQKDGHFFNEAGIVGIADGHETKPIPSSSDYCRYSETQIQELALDSQSFLHKGTEGSFSEKIMIESQKEAFWEWDMKIPFISLEQSEIKFSGSVKALEQISFKYDLMGRHDYISYSPSGSMSYCWSWK